MINEFLLSTSLDLNIKVWDLNLNKCLKTFQIEGQHIITRMIWIPQLKLVMTTSLKGDVKLIDPFDKEANFTLQKQFVEDSGISHIEVVGRLAYEGTKLVDDPLSARLASNDKAPQAETEEPTNQKPSSHNESAKKIRGNS